MKILLSSPLLTLLFLPVLVFCQTWTPPDDLASCTVYHSIQITMDEGAYQKILEARGVKLELNKLSLAVDGRRAWQGKLRLHGQSTLNFRRKSYSVTLERAIPVPMGEQELKLRKFYLLSLSMDHSYFRNQLAFSALNEINLFPLAHGFVELVINRESQGLYLLIQRPEDYALQEAGAAYVMRRTYKGKIDDFKTGNKVGKQESDRYNALYPDLLKACQTLRGEDLYRELDRRLDLHAYFQWLAFNYWIGNGDYADELFLYTADKPDTARLHPIPWDYDDIFANRPHEGEKMRERLIGDKLLFSGESPLDRAIATDTYLYEQYLGVLAGVLHFFDENRLSALFDQVYCELNPYFQREMILQNAQYDKYGITNPDILRKEMANIFQYFLLQRKTEILDKLAAGK